MNTFMEKLNGNLILIGLMGAGKTTLGRQFAQMYDCPFYDSDLEICSASGVSISTIFEMEGEEGFRHRETLMLKKLSALNGMKKTDVACVSMVRWFICMHYLRCCWSVHVMIAAARF